jgi:23S rRNA (adenine1618-N6)-methyltransferase|tara:strand:+ start:2560 stop:3504 length:945 start_codon:yes stop_codon:yes gene_type:complete
MDDKISVQEKSKIKTNLHPKNKNREQYKIEELLLVIPELKDHIKKNKLGEDSIHFSDPVAIKLLNKALLRHYYGIKKWEFPDTNLCPPIPGRADYIHYMSDLLNNNDNITCLDIGVGASCIYPILGVSEYNWSFIASEVNTEAITIAKKIIKDNPSLKGKVKFRVQKDENNIFKGIIKPKDKIDLSICNPPFHSSKKEALKGSMRKIRNLSGERSKKIQLNFSGVANELVYKGGEYQFIKNMIEESILYSNNCLWFTTLVSKEKNLKSIYKLLEDIKVKEVKTLNIGTSNKKSRIVVWTFQTKEEQKNWKINKN